jgi:hypothetical protein
VAVGVYFCVLFLLFLFFFFENLDGLVAGDGEDAAVVHHDGIDGAVVRHVFGAHDTMLHVPHLSA